MSFFEQRTFYHDGMRELQDEFDGRRVADAIERNRKHYAFWDDEREWIQSTPFFFIASAFGEHVDCSVKCGDPGFVKIVGENVIEYPEYDGSSMYRTLGNLRKNPSVGLLFVKFDGKSRRIRINGKASIHTEREWRWPERDRCHHLGSARAGSVTSALEPLRMAKKLDPCRNLNRTLSPVEQRTIVQARRTPHKSQVARMVERSSTSKVNLAILSNRLSKQIARED
jgi:hypothetical protein